MTSSRQRNLALAALGVGSILGARLAARRWRGRGPEGAGYGYPPLERPKPIGERIWIVDAGPRKMMGGAVLPLRMTVIALLDGRLLLHSPVPYTPELAQQIEALGDIAHLVAPSMGHWTFLEGWQGAYPATKTWAVPGLGERRQVRRSAVRIDEELAPDAPTEWAGEVEQGIIAGSGFTEAWFFHQASRTLILTDLVQNAEPARLPLGSAALMRMAGSTRAQTPRHLRLALRLAGDEARAGIERLIALEPRQVVFAHGEWFNQHGAQRLKAAFDWLG